MASGSCLCGGITYRINQTVPDAVACHCQMCRKQTGHFLVTVEVDKNNLEISGSELLKWYDSSEKARRGFCGKCGSVLFFDAIHQPWIAVTTGTMTPPTETRINLHIYTKDKGDYYRIDPEEKQE